MIKSFAQAVKFIEQYIPTPDKKHPGELGLSRMQYLMQLLDNPQLKYPTIHVGGTSGKGSTATIIASILSTKYKVGLHTSPHLVKINERIKIFSRGPLAISARGPLIREEDIPDKEFIALLNKVIPFINKVEESSYGKPSYFEIIAAMAFLHFYLENVDIAVIEVGMGGRYDATNVIKPLVAVITNIGLDHTEILGDTVEKIARDKAGIIKSGGKVVSGAKQQSVIEIISAKCNPSTSLRARVQSAKLSLLVPPPRRTYARQFLHHPRSPSATSEVFPWLAFSYRIKKLDELGSVFDYEGGKLLKSLRLRLLGEHQVENAAMAIRVVEISRGPLAISARGPLIKEKDIRLGLLSAFIPGRLEIIRKRPLIILDGAHNPDKVKALVTSVKKIFPNKKVTAIIAIKSDKNATLILNEILPICTNVIVTKFRLTTDLGDTFSYAPKELKEIISRGPLAISARGPLIKEDPIKAVKEAIRFANPDDLILVTGSLYLVGEIKSALSVKGKA